MNDTQEKYTLNVSNINGTVQKYTENHESSYECIEKPKMLEYFNDGKTSNISAVSDNIEDVQRQNSVQSNIEDGGDSSSNREKNIQLETIEKKEFEELNMENDKVDKVQIIAERNKLSNDQTTTIKAEINKVQDEMKIMCVDKITKELENTACFKAIVDKMVDIHSHIDQFIVVVNGLKFMLEDTCENKETISEIMELSEYLRSHYAMQVTENQRNFIEQINKQKIEIDQLKTYAEIKMKEVGDLEGRANDQKLCIDSYEKSMKYVTDKLSNFSSYIKQLQNENDQISLPNEKQKDFLLLLSEQLEGIDELLKTTKNQDLCDDKNQCNTFKEECIQCFDEEKDLFVV